jgi:hypothetical protein
MALEGPETRAKAFDDLDREDQCVFRLRRRFVFRLLT